MTSSTSASTKEFASRLSLLPAPARKLLSLIARQAFHGSLRSKPRGTATMPEVHEACGLDVDAMYSLLEVLRDSGFITVEGEYPFEALRLTGDLLEALPRRCEAAGIPIEDVLVDLRFDLLD